MKKALALTGLCALLLAGCGQKAAENAMEKKIEGEIGGDADVDMKADGSMHIETDDGTFEAGEDVSMPADWPSDVAVYAGSKVMFAGSATPQTGQPGSLVILSTTDSAADVNAYYAKQLQNDGWKIEATMQQAGNYIVSASKDTRVFSMSAAQADGQTSVTLGLSLK